MEKSKITIGIQGGHGSFNEAALELYLKKNRLEKNKIEVQYLYTSDRVLHHVSQKKVDFGVFALHNTIGGFVTETLKAIGTYQFSLVDTVQLDVEHCLMKLRTVPFEKITTVMAHPHAIKQCTRTLQKKYPQLLITSGKGDLIDHAKVAEELAEGNISEKTAVIGSTFLAQIYDLEIVDADMKDEQNNVTTFCVVQSQTTQL
jgi:prephenate dehydratase